MTEYHDLPELDTSLPDNDLGSMASLIIVTLCAIGALMWVLK